MKHSQGQPQGRRWAVVGSGMMGLSIAWELAKSGHAVDVIEASDNPGGLTGTEKYGDISWDRFYHVVETGDQQLLSLLDEIGLDSAVHWHRTRTNFFDGLKLYPLNNALDFATLPTLSIVDKARLAINIVYGASRSNLAPLEELSAEQWLSRWSGKSTYEKLWLPLLRSKLGDNATRVTAAYICGVMKRFYGARGGASRSETFGYLEGGYQRVVETLLEQAIRKSVSVHVGEPVKALEAGDDAVEVTLQTTTHIYDRVVLTMAPPLIATLEAPFSEEESGAYRATRYQGVVCPSLLLNAKLGDAYLTYITDQHIPFTTVIEMSSLMPKKITGGYQLVYLPKYVPSDSELFDQSDQEIIATFWEGLQRLFPHLDDRDIIHSCVNRARHVLVIPEHGKRQELVDHETSLPGVFLCHGGQIVDAALSVDQTVALARKFCATFSNA